MRPPPWQGEDFGALDAEELPPLLSRRTPAWDRLLAEGLHHPDSGYPRLEPPTPVDKKELAFWEDRVLHEYRNGACGDPSAGCLAADA